LGQDVYALIGPENRFNDSHGISERRVFSSSKAPTDTAWGVKWIGAPQVWEQDYEGEEVFVSILDTGIWYYHSDLFLNMWRNPGEIPDNNIDDNENGYIDDYFGYNFDSHLPDPVDDYGHGTHVAGTVAGNGMGGVLTGVAPKAKLMACKVLDSYGSGEESNVWETILYLCDNGGDVMSLSIG